MDRSWIVDSNDRPHPIAVRRGLRRQEYASDNVIAVEHDVIIFSIVERAAVLAARRFENQRIHQRKHNDRRTKNKRPRSWGKRGPLRGDYLWPRRFGGNGGRPQTAE
jgi:hypothetical protein